MQLQPGLLQCFCQPGLADQMACLCVHTLFISTPDSHLSACHCLAVQGQQGAMTQSQMMQLLQLQALLSAQQQQQQAATGQPVPGGQIMHKAAPAQRGAPSIDLS